MREILEEFIFILFWAFSKHLAKITKVMITLPKSGANIGSKVKIPQ
jgi:hypothetical protein